MPLNHIDLKPQLTKFVRLHDNLQTEIKTKLQTALEWLKKCGEEHAGMKERIRTWAEQIQPTPRCGIPYEESADSVFPAVKDITEYQLIASDGSQMVPSRHDPVPVALFNSSCIHFRPGSGSAPWVQIYSKILTQDDSIHSATEISEELVSLKRDVEELRVLANWEKPAPGQAAAIALLDGPMELFHEPRRIPDFERDFQRYLELMEKIHKKQNILAGYTDKPRAALIIKMLEIASASENKAIELSGLTDLELFSSLLGTGQRSAVYSLLSPSSDNYRGALALHFFYLNVGSRKKPSIARVEIPQWVAADTGSIGLLHQALLAQCRLMGARPYPYILHRAHEEALVSREEKQQLMDKLALMLQLNGVGIFTPSNKQAAKDLEGRRRL